MIWILSLLEILASLLIVKPPAPVLPIYTRLPSPVTEPFIAIAPFVLCKYKGAEDSIVPSAIKPVLPTF